MAASANSIKKAMKLERQDDGTWDMTIHVQVRPNQLAYVDGRPCGDFSASPARTTQGLTETVVATVTELVKVAEGPAGQPGVGRQRMGEIAYRNKYGEGDAVVLADVRAYLAEAMPGVSLTDDEIHEAIGWACTTRKAVSKTLDWLAARS